MSKFTSVLFVILAFATALLLVTIAPGAVPRRQNITIVSVAEQDLTSSAPSFLGEREEELQIELHQPRFIEKSVNISFNHTGAKLTQTRGSIRSAILETPFPLSLVRIQVNGQKGVSHPGYLKAWVRSAPDLSSWSRWQRFKQVTEAEFFSPDRFEGQEVNIPKEDKYVQFRVDLQGDEQSPSLESIRFDYVEVSNIPLDEQERMLRKFLEDPPLPSIQSTQDQISTAAAMQAVAAPRIISRTDWGCPDGQIAPREGAPAYPNTPITHLVVHHTRLGTRSNDYKRWVQNIWEEHNDKWGDIGYNLLIDPDGNVYEGRAGGIDAKGFHFACRNSYTTGVALLGDFSRTRPTQRALTTLRQVLAWRAEAWGINPRTISLHFSPDPSYPLRYISNIAGHRDVNPVTWTCTDSDARSCPGDALYALLPTIRSDVNRIISPGFSIQSEAIGFILRQGQDAVVRVILESYGGQQGTAALSVSGLPQGITVQPTLPMTAFLPANGTVTATLTLKSSLNTQTGSFSPVITAALGGVQRSVRISLIVTPGPGSVMVNATNNGQPWSGAVDYSVVGPQSVVIGLAVPRTTSNLPAGQYRLIYNQGGPGPLTSVTPAATQILSSGGTLTFTMNFGNSSSPLTVTCSTSPSTITTGQSSTFTASASGGLPPYRYTWSGSVSGSTSSVSRIFANAGVFQATVTVTDSSSPAQSRQSSCTVQVNSIPQPLSITACTANPSEVRVGENVQFMATITGGTQPYRYYWDGATTPSNSNTYTRAFGVAGLAGLQLRVTDSSNPIKEATANCGPVTVVNTPPPSFDLVMFTNSKTIQAGQSTSYDFGIVPRDGFTGTVTWNVSGLPSGVSVTNSNRQILVGGPEGASFTMNLQSSLGTPTGTYPLTVSASSGVINRSLGVTLTVTAAPQMPLSASCSISPNPITLGQGATVSASGSGGVGPYRYRINGVDMGSVSSLLVLPTQAGIFTTSVTITDILNQQALNSCSAQVILPNPFLTRFEYTPNPARAGQDISFQFWGGNFISGQTQVWFFGPGCTNGCQHPNAGVTVSSGAFMEARNVRLGSGTYTCYLKNSPSGSLVQAGTVTVVP